MAKSETNRYKETRKALDLSREAAADALGMSDDKLERIENGKQYPTPQDVLRMSDVYKTPSLCNYFCNHDCEIGQMYVPEVPDSSLPNIILNLLKSVNEFQDVEKQLISITADGTIDENEIPEMVQIQYTLEQLSVMIEALQLCIEKKIDNGEIDKNLYEQEIAKIKTSKQ